MTPSYTYQVGAMRTGCLPNVIETFTDLDDAYEAFDTLAWEYNAVQDDRRRAYQELKDDGYADVYTTKRYIVFVQRVNACGRGE